MPSIILLPATVRELHFHKTFIVVRNNIDQLGRYLASLTNHMNPGRHNAGEGYEESHTTFDDLHREKLI